MDSEKQALQLQKRLQEMADKSYTQNMFTFTGFLGMAEQAEFWKIERQIAHVGYVLNGGREGAERQMVRFGKVEELGYEVPFPIRCLHIEPLMRKFAEKLTHRDFLGALMNLGIERSTLGDIIVGEKEAYLFCVDTMAQYICDNLTQIRHTHVTCTITENYEELLQEEPEVRNVQVASMRVDAVIAKVYNKSRNECLELFRTGKVFVDGRLCENNARILKGGEVINARGFGKFQLTGEVKETRKGKLSVTVAVFR